MPSSSLRIATTLFPLLLAACQLSMPDLAASPRPDPATSAVQGGEIEVTPLDTLPMPLEAKPPEPSPDPLKAGEMPVEALQTPPAPPPAGEHGPVETAVEPPAAPAATKLEAQISCERKGGSWTSVGKAKFRACVKTTKDSGKACTRQSQCDSQCLARSGTCAPFKPMFGCNEVLQENGARVMLCID